MRPLIVVVKNADTVSFVVHLCVPVIIDITITDVVIIDFATVFRKNDPWTVLVLASKRHSAASSDVRRLRYYRGDDRRQHK